MKIAFVTPQMIVGGAETYIIRKAQWLIGHGYEVIVISNGGEFVDALPAEVKHYKLNVHQAPYKLSYKELKKVLQTLSQILKREKVDMVEAHNSYPIIFMSMSYSYHHVPFILNVLLELSYDRNPLLCILTRFLDKKGLYCTLTTTMNEYIEKKCYSKLNPVIIPIPISVPNISNRIESDYFLTVGRMSEEKMYVKYLIRDFGNLLRSHSELKHLKLYVVGDGILKEKVDSIARETNTVLKGENVVLLGTVVGKELDELYKNCLAYIGVGTTMLIAASFKKPTILAAGFEELQPYSFGFWGEEPEKDKELIGGKKCIYYRRTSFDKTMWEVVSDKTRKKQVANMSFQLFKEVYDMEVIMGKWDLLYKNKSKTVFNFHFMERMCLRIAYLFLHLVYRFYKIFHYCPLKKWIVVTTNH